jgi:hypothetical protein
MKTLQTPNDGLFQRVVFTASLLIGFVSPILAASSSPEGKDHVLFVGTDLSVKQDGQFYHVVRATKDSFLVERDHAIKEVRGSQAAEIKVTRGVKLSSLSATIDNFKTDSVDRAAAQAQFAAMHEQILMTDAAGDTADRIHGRMIVDSTVAVNPSSTAAYATPNGPPVGRAPVTLDAYADALTGLQSNISAASTFYFEKNQRSDSAGVELSFDVSSPEKIENAYLVVVANYVQGDKVARQISARELKEITSRPTRIKLVHPATLSGLEFKKFDVALYANGQEVATNVSEKRMPLTTDQAYKFFYIDYLSKHAGASTPPAAMLMTPRAEFREKISNVQTDQPIYATVDKTGTVVAISTDEAGAEKIPASMESALQHVRFFPALQNGNPVDGRVKITLAQLVN